MLITVTLLTKPMATVRDNLRMEQQMTARLSLHSVATLFPADYEVVSYMGMNGYAGGQCRLDA